MTVQSQQQKNPSLHEVMNLMAQRVGGLQPRDRTQALGQGVLSEAEAYAHFDPLLGQLLKEYRDAQARHEELLQRNGADDAMAAVAADLAASCDNAVETRLMELRTQNTLRRMAAARMRESMEIMNASARYQEKLKNHQQRNAVIARMRREEAKDGMLWVWFVILMLQLSLERAQRRLSAAQAFTMVSTQDDEQRIVA